jgi:hypothetical protein
MDDRAILGRDRRRAVLVALALTWVGLALSAAFPQQAGAINLFGLDIPTPLDLAGEVVSWFGEAAKDTIVGAFVDLLNWLFGTLVSTITVPLIKWMTSIDLIFGGPLEAVAAPVVVIGGFFLLIGTLATVMQGMGRVAAGMDSPSRAVGAALFRLAGLALLMASWFTLVPAVVDLANGMSGYVLTDDQVKEALKQTFIAGTVSGGITDLIAPILMVIMLLLVAFTLVILLLLKYVLIFTFALLYVGGPAAIGAGAFPGIGAMALAVLVRMLFICMCIPLAWCVVFAAWAGVSAGLAQAPASAGDAAMKIINGPGIFCAATLVVLGVTRALLRMATPLGVPLSPPGTRLAVAMAAYKVGGPALARVTGGGASVGATRGESGRASTSAPSTQTWEPEVFGRAPGPNALPRGTQGGPNTIGAAAMSRATAQTPDAMSAARTLLSAPPGAPVDAAAVADALSSLTAGEQQNVARMAQRSLEQPEPEEHFRESVVASYARGEFRGEDNAAVIASASPQMVASAAGLGTAPEPSKETVGEFESSPAPPPPVPAPRVAFRHDELVGPPPPPAPPPAPAPPPPTPQDPT